jgi:AraC-like DNA-binding protein
MNPPIKFSYRESRKIDPEFHSHPEYEIFYFHHGHANYLIGGHIYTLFPGDLIIMHGMTLHRPKVDERYDYVRTVIHFDPSYVLGTARLEGIRLLRPFEDLKNHKIALTRDEKEEFEQLLQRMHRLHQHQDPIFRHRFVLALVDLLLFMQPLFTQWMQRKREFPSEKEKNVQNIITFLDQHYMDDIRLDFLEKELHLSKYYLAKIFKEVTGVTIFEYLFQRRVNQAKVILMTEPSVSVTDVCYRVGFKHPAHFSRVFKAKVGHTPQHFKRLVANGPQ